MICVNASYQVSFVEPVVITACEFLEQNACSASSVAKLMGATFPPSFALEVFVQCEGETRFRRLCHPFLYSHSSSNVLEVEAIVTSHLVVRGSYRSLSLVIHGNTAGDLGQFNIEVDLDTSLTDLVCSTEGKLDDLPPALQSKDSTIEKLITPDNVLSLPVVPSDISIEIKKLLQLIFKILELSRGSIDKVTRTVTPVAFSYAMYHFPCAAIYQREFRDSRSNDIEEVRQRVLEEGVEDLHDFCRSLESIPESNRAELSVECSSFESEADLVTSKQLMEMLNESFYNRWNPAVGRCPQFSQEEEVTMWLAVALLLCSGREGCFHFVTGGGMESLASVLRHDLPDSTAITLLLLAVIESATRYSVGCEGFLGWWPREDDSIPSSISEGYSQLLKLLLHKQRHDVASLATHVLHRLRLYEVASKYECAVLSVLGSISGTGKVTDNTLDMLIKAKSQLKNLLELTNTCGPIEDPSSVACASRSLIIGQSEGLLSYDTTCSLLASSICQFFNSDLDLHLLSLLKERGFLPLSAALLSSLILHSEVGRVKDIYMDIVSLIEALILSLLFCRSGLIFLLLQPELCVTLVHALRGVGDINKEDFVPLRYASVLVRKGFFCRPREIGVILEMHLRVVCAIDRLLMAAPSTEEFLWVLWELCDVSRSDCGRQALLAVVHFPEAVSVLIEALHSVKDSEEVAASSGTSPINLAILHSAAEICEVIVTDSTVLSLLSWIEHAMELHKALHSASPGSNRKDTPTRLLEWIDAGVVYHKNGAIGLLIYGSVLASGGDAHLSSTSILVSDSVDLESAVGDSSSSSDVHVIENLVKLISEKSFDGVALRDSSIAQLTTTFRILAFISESPVVAAALYDEGAVTVICAVLINCGFMLERSSNNYDYLIDEGTECNSTSDLLLERYREQSLVDLLVPCLILLINLLQKLQEAKEQHRNSKLMNALLRLHREVSSKLAACAENLSSPYSDTALGFGAVCHLLVSALACWPVYGWAPGLFHSLLSSVEATSLLAPGLKETCSLMCVLNDIFPEEGVWLWKNGMPLLSGLRSLAVATILGPRKERQVNWYLLPKHLDTLLSQLRPHLEKIAQIILHYAITSLVVVQDLLRVFIVRMACRKAENAVVLLRPVTSWIHDHLSESSSLKDTESYKVYRVLDFLGSLLEHPYAKSLLLKENVVHMLADVLERVISSFNSDGKEFSDDETSTEIAFSPVSWCIPVFKSFVLICDTHPSLHLRLDKHNTKTFSAGDYSLILCYIIRFCQVLPVGKELLACLIAFKELGSCSICQSALTSIFSCNGGDPELHGKQERDANYNLSYKNDWAKSPPLLCCWKKLLRTAGSKDGFSSDTIEAVSALSLGALHFSMDAKSLNLNRVAAVKFLFGIPCNVGADDDFSEENIKYIKEMVALLNFKISDDDNFATADTKTNLLQALECAESLLLLMKRPTSSVIPDDKICSEDVHLLLENILALLNKHGLVYDNMNKVDDSYYVGGFDDKFIWECQTVPDRLSQVTPSVKKKLSSGEVPSRRARGDNSPVEVVSRGQGLAPAPPGLTRRDTFRQRKPNTSRPPSMHVDDYVARERNTDVHASSNVIAVQRVGSSGRPPSIHVDEFIARQKERQNLVAMAVGKVTAQSKSAASENNQDAKELEKSEHLKADIDDDLQGIDIVFDAEESESEDKLLFPQLDDNLQQPGPLIVEQNSPRSIVEETECDVNETAHSYHLPRAPASTVHDSIQSESSLRPSEDPICFSDKKLTEQSDDSENAISMKASASPGSSGFLYRSSASPAQLPASINRYPPRPHFYPISSPQETGHASPAPGPQGSFDQIFHSGQPPLPPMPPPPAIANLMSQKLDKVPSQPYSYGNSMKDGQPVAFHGRSEFVSGFTGISVPTSSAPGASSRPLPPLPPTPPPSASTPIQTVKSSVVQSRAYNNQASVGITQPSSLPSSDALLGSMLTSGTGLNAYPPAPFMRLLGFSRPASPMPQQGSSSPHILPNLCISQSSIQPIQPLAQLQPLQPPQLPRPPQPPQYPRPAIQQPAQVMASPLQQPIQILQPPQASPLSAHFRSQGEESSSEVHAHQQGEESALQQPSDSAMSLQQHFSSPEAIQSLLSDRDKLCQLLEQHPKLMQMLQERLGQL